MADKKISQLTAATTPLTGTETLPIVQGGQTVKATAQDIADLVSTGFAYEIGQYVASQGGVVVDRWYSNTPGGVPTAGSFQTYIVIDTADLSASAPWGLSGTDVPGAGSRLDGQTNTAEILAAGCLSTDAAGLCGASTNGGQNDWYLPALYEWFNISNNLYHIEQGLQVAGGTSFTFNYWSSTEQQFAPSTQAYVVTFNGGYMNNVGVNKTSTYAVRAIRKFSL